MGATGAFGAEVSEPGVPVVLGVLAGATAAATGVATLVVRARTAVVGEAERALAVDAVALALLCWECDAESDGPSAHATADPLNAAAPTPRATAKPPTRPINRAALTSPPIDDAD